VRPLRLLMQAFGPYAGAEVIDFTTLPDSSLFLVTGPTGAGKSTLIDAMSYALYGQTCTEERSGEAMRCQVAPAELPTEVTFDYRLGDQTYRVTRSPEQERPKMRGEGTITAPGKATIWRRTGVTDEAGEGAVLASKKSEVTACVQDLLGFDCSQFRQVMVLPQGRFREVLTADSKSREEILERLFQTGIYTRIQWALKERAREVVQRHQDLRTQRETILHGIEVETSEELSRKLGEAFEGAALLEAERDRLNNAATKAAEALEEARQIKRKYEERDESEKELEHLAKEQPGIEVQRTAFERARKAEPLVALEEAVVERERESALAITALEQTRKDLANCLNAREAADKNFESEKARESTRFEAERDLTLLCSLRPKVGSIDAKRDALTKARGKSEQTRAALEKLHADLSVSRKKIELIGKEIESLQAKARQCEIINERYRNLRGIGNNRAHLEKSLAESKSVDEALTRCETEVARCERDLAASRAREDALHRAWKNGRAAILAATLKDGVPCPVCGATHHPNLASSDEIPPGDDEIEQAKQLTAACDVALNEARRVQVEHSKASAEIAERIRGLNEQLGDYATRAPYEIEQELEELARQERSAHAAAKQSDYLREKLDCFREWEKQLVEEIQELDSVTASASNQVATLEAELAAIERDVPENLRSLAALNEALSRSERAIDDMKNAFKKAADNKDAADDRAARAETRVAEVEVSVRASAERFQEVSSRFKTALVDAGFEDRSAFDIASKKLTGILEIELMLKRFDERLAAAITRNARATAALEGLTMPDLEMITASATSARQAADGALTEHATRRAEVRQLEKTKRDLEFVESQIAEIQKEHETVGRLAEVATGKNERRLTLQRYVLASLLDDVLVAASRRLTIMSRGRYEMRRDRTVRDQRSAGGLDLEILDAFSGQSRAAGTLSGGESFLAALSLALGLSDVVQAHTGGIRMETLFVDEGFGSLDSEALDHAFQALMDLQKGGRMVGIISHVEELKQRIDTRLEITAGQRGSHAKFVGTRDNRMGLAP
jgi:exonuclease SbcC